MGLLHHRWPVVWALACAVTCSSGCAILTTNRTSKPDPALPTARVKYRYYQKYIHGLSYPILSVDTPEAKLQLAILNTRAQKELGLILVVPVEFEKIHPPDRKPDFEVWLSVKPKRPGLIFEPYEVLYANTNQIGLAPSIVKAWTINHWKGENEYLRGDSLQHMSIKKRTYFHLDYDVDANPEIRFQLSMEGLSASEIPIELPPLTFGPAGIKHCELHFLIF